MKLSRQPFRRTTNSPVVAAKTKCSVDSPTQVSCRTLWTCPSSVIAVSEGGDAEVTLGTAFSMLELEDDCIVAGGQSLVTPEKQKRRHREESAEDTSPDPTLAASDESSLPCLPFPNTTALLDCDISSYESPIKSSSLMDKSFLSASPALVLLLDESATPEKVPSYCGLTLCDDGDGVPLPVVNIQAQISQFLGAPTSNIGESWQKVWTQEQESADSGERCFLPADEKPSEDTIGRESGGDGSGCGKEELRRRLQRAFVHRIHDQQSSHIAELKRRMQPFSIGSEPCRNDAHLNQRRARSFQDCQARMSGKRSASSGESRSSHRRGSATTAKATTQGRLLTGHVFPLWSCGMHCGTLTDDELSPVLKSRKRPGDRLNSNAALHSRSGSDDDEDDYYDSDPETFASTRNLFHENKENIPPSDDCDLGIARLSFSNRERSSDSLAAPQVEPDDPSAKVVQEMFNERFTIVVQEQWAVRFLSDFSFVPQRSRGVHAWLERGQQLKCRVVPPKLVMNEIGSERQTTSISLLDIVRIVEAELLHFDEHMMQSTLALKSHMFYIQTIDSSIFVEAGSRAERDRLVDGLKVVVARLGSFLLCNDDRLLDEFFLSNPDSIVMVGQEPFEYLLREYDSDDDAETCDV